MVWLRFKLQSEKIIKEALLPYTIVLLFFMLFTFVLGKYLEGASFVLSHILLRPQMDREYHSEFTIVCLTLTTGILFTGIYMTFPISISLLSTIPITYIIVKIGSELALKVELRKENKELELKIETLFERIRIVEQTDIFVMAEPQLRSYAQKKGLNEATIDTLVMRVCQNMRWVDIAYNRYSKDGMRYHKQQILDKLKIDKI